MRKLKIVFLTLAIIVAICGAYGGAGYFGTWRTALSKTKAKADPVRDLTPEEKKSCDCTQFTQYAQGRGSSGYYYFEVWEGDYECLSNVGVCTYYRPNPFQYPNFYQLCTNGAYWGLIE